MDSFYDTPRNAPIPTYVDQISATPTVPEVSLVCNASRAPLNDYASYNTWRNQEKAKTSHPHIRTLNCIQFSGPQNVGQLSKKQVRFQSPMQQQRPSLTYEPFITRKKCQFSSDFEKVTPSEKREESTSKNPFQQLYMANIPTRQLDLSIIELPSNSQPTKDTMLPPDEPNSVKNDNVHDNKENKLPKTYRDFLDMQKSAPKTIKPDLNDSVTDIFNYKRNCMTPERTECDKIFAGKQVPSLIPSRFHGTLPQFGHNNVINQSERGSNIDINEKVPESNPANIMQNQNCVFPSQPSPSDFKKTSNSEMSTQTSPRLTETAVQIKENSEPTTKDLLKIIAKQNEQLMLLQRQVATLLDRDLNQNKPIEDVQRVNYVGERCITSTQNENVCTPRKRAGMSKFSIDLMTSFEVAIRQQPKSNFVNCEAKIQEITETESVSSDKYADKQTDQSLQLKEPVRIQESCPSPEPSININMNDYDSSEDEVSASEIGATFYNNLMGQVNNILRKAQLQTKEDIIHKKENKPAAHSDKKKRTLNKVKEATLKHLKSIGVSVADTEGSDSRLSCEDDSKTYSPTEISFAVKQLLMKYLPDEELAKIQQKHEKCPPPVDKKDGFISPRPEFSFASVQYMKKYNLIPSNEAKGTTNRFEQKPAQRFQQAQADSPKILDLTALKMQPKLL